MSSPNFHPISNLARKNHTMYKNYIVCNSYVMLLDYINNSNVLIIQTTADAFGTTRTAATIQQNCVDIDPGCGAITSHSELSIN